MTACIALQAATVRAALLIPELTGTFDGPPARAEFPYLVVNCSREVDWSCATRVGREIAVELTLWDDQPARLLTLEQALEQSIGSVAEIEGWVLANFRLTAKSKVRDPNGPWAGRLEWRARLLEQANASTP